MKLLPTGMQADLDSRATHHCFCWQVTRNDNLSFGFTDHDQDLSFNGVNFSAETGLNASAVESSVGLSVDNMDVMGVLNAISIDEQDLAAGLYDNATITAYRVDWRSTDKRIIVLQGHIGEVSRGNLGFTAEVRGLAHEMNQRTGKIYSPTCNVDLGDSFCGINLNNNSPAGHAYTVTTSVTSVNALNSFYADNTEVQAVPAGWFSRGLATWVTGDNIGLRIEIKSHTRTGNSNAILLWEPMPYPISAGDQISLQVGCDKTAATCLAKFNNMLNFRGFNLIPGTDIILRSAVRDEDNSGGSIF